MGIELTASRKLVLQYYIDVSDSMTLFQSVWWGLNPQCSTIQGNLDIWPHGEKPASSRAEDRIKGKDKMLREVIFVIDGSGSMGTKATDVRGGFNTYVEELLKDPNKDEYRITAAVFNTGVFPLFKQLPLSEVPKLTEKNYIPGGGTALYDAISDTVDGVKDAGHFCFECGKARNKAHKFCTDCGKELNGDSAFIVIIMTDGEENSSQRFRKHHIVNKIQGKEKLGNWSFIYMGANQDAMQEGAAIGIQYGNAITYDTNFTRGYYSKLAAGTANTFNVFTATGSTGTAGSGSSFSSSSGQDWTATAAVTPTVTGVGSGDASSGMVDKKTMKVKVKK